MVRALKCFARSRGLTPREYQILRMICEGYKDTAIAARLRVRRTTVRFHINNIHQKCETSDKLEIVLAVWRCSGTKCRCTHAS